MKTYKVETNKTKKGIKYHLRNLIINLTNNGYIVILILALLVLQLLPYSMNTIVTSGNVYTIKNWGLGYNNNLSPTGTDTPDFLKQYNSYFIDARTNNIENNNNNENTSMNVYLTFDAGYENGYTPKILDALKATNVPATFFLVGNYFKTQPELVKRMVNEGHIVGNHTVNHPNITKISDDKLLNEIQGIENQYKDITGKEMKKFFRPPSGSYNNHSLEVLNQNGYTTIFWSLAYVDWLENNQPSHDEAMNKLMSRIHPGAIILLHSTSKTNSEILERFINEVKSKGYTFRSLDYLTMDENQLKKNNDIVNEQSESENEDKSDKNEKNNNQKHWFNIF